MATSKVRPSTSFLKDGHFAINGLLGLIHTDLLRLFYLNEGKIDLEKYCVCFILLYKMYMYLYIKLVYIHFIEASPSRLLQQRDITVGISVTLKDRGWPNPILKLHL